MDETQPLPRGTGFHFHGMAAPVWLKFRFENLPDFCHYCGRLSHIVNHCHEFLAKCDSSSAPPLLHYDQSLGAKIRITSNPFYIACSRTRLRPHIANPASLAPSSPYRFHQAPVITEGPFNEPTSAYGIQHLSQPQTTLMGLHANLSSPHFNLNHSPPTTTFWPAHQTVAAAATMASRAQSPAVSPNITAPSHLPTFPPITTAEQLATPLLRPISTTAEALVATTGVSQHVVQISQAFSTILSDLNPAQPPRFAVGSSTNPTPSSTRVRKFKPQRNLFTWTNRQKPPHHTQERIDWCLSNEAWDAIFPASHLNHGDFFGSDHRPLILNLSHMSDPHTPPPRFIFDKLWMSEPGFEDCLREAWTQTTSNTHSNPLTDLNERLANCSSRLNHWKKSLGPPLTAQIRIVQSQLQLINSLPNPTTEQLEQSQKLEEELSGLLQKEEVYWQQRSRVTWLKLGDKNTRYFHRMASQRRTTNKILSLQRLDGSWANDTPSILATIEQYFTTLFQSQMPDNELWNCRNIWLHEGLSPSPNQIIRDASIYFEQYKNCTTQEPTPSPAQEDHSILLDSRTSPPTFHHRLFVDAAQDSQLLKMGFGMTIHSNTGDVLLNLAKPRSVNHYTITYGSPSTSFSFSLVP
ncbi:hypothetical protein F8388_002981 [Cannabis sativa]|uniref:Zinc knuckle CX2CX4HX4C domain-containing protein n=1 Tax=Cannabis sativa TaxID=3483 RepID=A0A7J6H6I2_CANSA|nr:hypothetical protein F8388_002981 [Cannabis sativa]KAF4398520.1 hypothetical protein G4B88_013609 [Cannabis sativa]